MKETTPARTVEEESAVVACDNLMLDAFHALDTHDLDAFAACVVDDLTFGPMASKTQVLEAFGAHPPIIQTHQLLNRRVWVDSTTAARSRCVISVYHFPEGREGPIVPSLVLRAGFTFRCEEGVWKIARHSIDQFLAGGPPPLP
jgi:SnoaL-like domain